MEWVRGVGATSAAGQGNHHCQSSPQSPTPRHDDGGGEEGGVLLLIHDIFLAPLTNLLFLLCEWFEIIDFIYKHWTTDHQQKIQTPIAKADQFLGEKKQG